MHALSIHPCSYNYTHGSTMFHCGHVHFHLQKKLAEVLNLGRKLNGAKETYKAALRQLDVISVEIEQRRHLTDIKRGENSSSLFGNMSNFEELDHLPGKNI